MYKFRITLTLILICVISVPHTAAASIVINEIAWMGSTGSANAEWIELYNDASESVPLSGWTLTGAGTSPNITLSGTIAGNGYYLLERTSDATVPTITAHQIYTGALSNSGDTLTLKDSTSAVIDQVVGGTNWANIGGDNTTKQTPQRNGSSWSTAAPTPGALNASGGSSAPTETATTTPPTETATTTPTTTIGGSNPVRTTSVESPVRQLYLDAGPDRIVVAGVATPFSAVAYSKNGSVRDARITWSFGDGGRELGEKVRHTFRKPGEYLVAVRAQEKESDVLVALRVVVEASSVSIAVDSDGILVTNTSDRLLDLSGWRLRSGEDEFLIPEDTGIWPSASVVFAYEDTGLPETNDVALLFPSGKVARESVEETEVPNEQLEEPEPGIQRVQTPIISAPLIETTTYEPVIDAPAAPTLSAAVGAAVPAVPSSWLMCLFGGLLACGASLVVR